MPIESANTSCRFYAKSERSSANPELANCDWYNKRSDFITISHFEHALNVYRYHHDASNFKPHPSWAKKFLRDSVESGYLTQEEADEIRRQCGESIQLNMF